MALQAEPPGRVDAHKGDRQLLALKAVPAGLQQQDRGVVDLGGQGNLDIMG